MRWQQNGLFAQFSSEILNRTGRRKFDKSCRDTPRLSAAFLEANCHQICALQNSPSLSSVHSKDPLRKINASFSPFVFSTPVFVVLAEVLVSGRDTSDVVVVFDVAGCSGYCGILS